MEKTYKCIQKPYLARNLLKMGNPIVDIKPDRDDNKKTIFVFEINEKFNEDMIKLLTENRTDGFNTKVFY